MRALFRKFPKAENMAKENSKENRGTSHRIHRVEREIREVCGLYLLSGFKGDLPGIVSISRVIVSKDLRQAKVLVTAMGIGAEETVSHKAVVKELQAAASEFQHEVNRKLRMKNTPKLTFHYDTGFEHAMRVENILRDLSKKRGEEAGAQGEDSDDEADDE